MAEHKANSWSKLFLYTITVGGTGFLLGHYATLCPSPGLRAALYPWHMHLLLAAMIIFSLFMFLALGFHLSSVEDQQPTTPTTEGK
jgi:hypothetical protein